MTAGSPKPGERWGRSDWLIAGLLFAATFVSRIPFRSTLFYAWDSVLYARALARFDVSIEQPHPPGHIFYVFLARVVNFFVSDPNAALVWVSVLFAAAAVAALFWLGRLMLGRGSGLLAALLLATSLSFWAYSEVAYPYTLLAFLSILTAGLIYLARRKESGFFILLAALTVGLGSGFRQDLLPFMLPLLVYGLIGMPWRRYLAAAGTVGAGVTAWYLPTVMLSGGLAKYDSVSSGQSDYIMQYNSVFGRGLEAITSNLHDVGLFTMVAAVSAMPLLIYFAVRMLIKPRAREAAGTVGNAGIAGIDVTASAADRRSLLAFLLVWTVPSLLFFIFIHIGEYGYVFVFLPALLVAAAWGAELLAGDLARRGGQGRPQRRFFVAISALAVCANLMLFLVLTPTLSANRLAARDGILQSRIDTIGESFEPDSTFIVSVFDYQQVLWYLRGYEAWHFDPLVNDEPVVELPSGTQQVLLFEEYLSPAAGEASDSVPLAYDQRLMVMYPQGHRYLKVDWPSRTVFFSDTR